MHYLCQFAPGQHSQGFVAMRFLTWKETVKVKLSISLQFVLCVVPWGWLLLPVDLAHRRKLYSTAISWADPGNRLCTRVLHLHKPSLCPSKLRLAGYLAPPGFFCCFCQSLLYVLPLAQRVLAGLIRIHAHFLMNKLTEVLIWKCS